MDLIAKTMVIVSVMKDPVKTPAAIEKGNEKLKIENYHVRGHCHQFRFQNLVVI